MHPELWPLEGQLWRLLAEELQGQRMETEQPHLHLMRQFRLPHEPPMHSRLSQQEDVRRPPRMRLLPLREHEAELLREELQL